MGDEEIRMKKWGDEGIGRLGKNSQKLSTRFSLTKIPFFDMKKLGWGSI
jgi:hypothetical protein